MTEPHAPKPLGSLQPDLIAEHLIVSELGRFPNRTALLVADLRPEWHITRSLTILARAAYQQSGQSVAKELIRTILTTAFDRIVVAALPVAIETNSLVADLINEALPVQKVPIETLVRLADAIPGSSLVLAPIAKRVLKLLLTEGGTDTHQRAGWLIELSNHLADMGEPQEALTAVKKAVALYQQLARERPGEFLPDLAMALNNESNRLAEVGQPQEALAAIKAAVAIYQPLARERPGEFLPDLAMALNNESNRLAEVGQPQEALAAIKAAVAIYQPLARERPDEFFPRLTDALNNESNCFTEMRQPQEALAAIEAAVAIYQPLARERPDAFPPAVCRNAQHLVDLPR